MFTLQSEMEIGKIIGSDMMSLDWVVFFFVPTQSFGVEGGNEFSFSPPHPLPLLAPDSQGRSACMWLCYCFYSRGRVCR